MSDSTQTVRTIVINNKETKVTFYNEITNQRITQLLADLEYFHVIAGKQADYHTKQFVHSLFIIKHFTDYKVKSNAIYDFILEAQRFAKDNLLEEFVKGFEIQMIEEINRTVAIHFIIVYGEVPDHLRHGLGEKELQYFKNAVEKAFLQYNDNDKDTTNKEDDYLYDDEDDEKEEFDSDFIVDTKSIEEEDDYLNEEELSDELLNSIIADYKHSIDKLLDEYNDYLNLYEVFGDDQYLQRASHVMRVLKGSEVYKEFTF